ncbi:MAG: 2-dehydro-3-deoxyphosphogluconate aldolase [Actinobacteria bacterium]|nr:bifunctional 4-hydroxy-2-oxoglutarate aldolase/2-dehydro-3-deoxy-phosphogluconate aldolase [Thermobifida fusca]PZM94646.1 MAG: 2-dehydro-3-deoxyphosphogluconate aldolase [Actinomycetota bacterium]
MISFESIFQRHRFMAVLRGLPARQAVEAAQRAWDLGIELVEVPIGDLSMVDALGAVVEAARERGKTVGAGTVITSDHVQAARDAGAAYTVAPGLDPDVLAASTTAGLPHLPGVATPSEVQQAWRLGCQWVKVFPAATLGPDWFRAIRGPFPTLRYVATGGITPCTASAYLEAGADIVAVGTAVTNPSHHNRLAELLRQYTPAP